MIFNNIIPLILIQDLSLENNNHSLLGFIFMEIMLDYFFVGQ
jgi:hypothetical protein